MTRGLAFSFQGQTFIARPSLALWWPKLRALILSDLHLGKAGRLARRDGVLLPPWDSQDTLNRLQAEITALDPAIVVSLGDSYDDALAASELAEPLQVHLACMAKGRDWHWIEGNHDPGLGMADLKLGEVTFRHELGQGPDVSGHFHPAIRLGGRRWRCFAFDQDHLILPSFGSFTGGLDVESADFRQIMPRGFAIAGHEGGMFMAPFPKPR